MEDRVINLCNERLAAVDSLICAVRGKLAELPQGRLHVHNIAGKTYYYANYDSDPRNRKTPVSDARLISGMAQRAYYLKVLRRAEEERKAIRMFLEKMPGETYEDFYDSMSESRKKLITPVRLPDDEYVRRWLAEPYARKGFRESDPYYLTENGERVRSKSEQLIANRLRSKGVPYRFEYPVQVGNEVFHPDFMILRLSDRKMVHYEHLGKMGDEEYSTNALIRIRKYSTIGITIGDKLFVTMENANVPFDIRVLDELIEKNFR